MTSYGADDRHHCEERAADLGHLQVAAGRQFRLLPRVGLLLGPEVLAEVGEDLLGGAVADAQDASGL